MTKQVIGIKRDTGPYDIWRVSFDGRVLGDSCGYTKDRAIAAAKWFVSRDDNRILDTGAGQ